MAHGPLPIDLPEVQGFQGSRRERQDLKGLKMFE